MVPEQPGIHVRQRTWTQTSRPSKVHSKWLMNARRGVTELLEDDTGETDMTLGVAMTFEIQHQR